jgi:hypothetical protein
MASFSELAGEAAERVRPVAELALVPFVWSLLQVGQVLRAVGGDSIVDLSFPFPQAVVGLWSFVNPPVPDGVSVVGPLWALPVLVVVEGLLTAGYLGSLHETFEVGKYDFVANARRYAVEMVAYAVAVVVVGLVAVGAAAVAGILGVLVGLPLLLLLGYAFFATPFLVVVEDCSFRAGLSRSYALAREGGAHTRFFVAYVLVGAGLSVPVSLFAYAGGLVTVVLASAAVAPVGLVLSATTLAFVHRHPGTGPGRGRGRRRPEGAT